MITLHRTLLGFFVFVLAGGAFIIGVLGQRGRLLSADITQNSLLPADSTYNAPVLSLRYFPVDGSGQYIDNSIAGGWAISLADMRARVDTTLAATLEARTNATRYHGYKDPAAVPSITYQTHEDKEFLVPIPVSTAFPKTGDKFKMFSDATIGVSDICNYVDNQGVKEVWIWMYHTANMSPIESNMAPKLGGIFGDYFYGYADISNSSRVDDLPRCNHTYTVYEYNYWRALSENLENHGHQIEAVLRNMDYTLFWFKWVSPYGQASPTVNRCGWTHSPPNTTAQYDWANTTQVLSDCEDWNPQRTGTVKTVDCTTWGGSGCANANTGFKVWWMQNIPGKGNGLTYNGEALRNWWDFFGDFDAALAKGNNLVVDVTSPTVSLTSPSTGVTVFGITSISARATDTHGVARTEFYADGALLGSVVTSYYSYDYSVNWDTTVFAHNSQHTLVAKAYDAAGNVGSSSPITVSVSDTSPPSVSLTNPLDGDTVSGTVALGALASDNDVVVRTEFYADGMLLGSATSTPYSVNWDTTVFAHNSQHTLVAKAYDAAGNVTSSQPITVTVKDIVPPTVAISSPQNGVILKQNATVTVSAVATDLSGVSAVEFFVNGNLLCRVSVSPYSCVWEVPRASGHVTYTIWAKAYDVAGNITAATISVIVK